jgi:hypothetical protein
MPAPQPIHDADAQGAPLADVLEVCARELQALTEQCERLQALISPVLRRVEDGEEIQAMDLLTQSLNGVAQYLAALSQGVAPGWRVDAAQAASGVTIHDLACRLQGVAAAPPVPSGDFDFFDGLP